MMFRSLKQRRRACTLACLAMAVSVLLTPLAKTSLGQVTPYGYPTGNSQPPTDYLTLGSGCTCGQPTFCGTCWLLGWLGDILGFGGSNGEGNSSCTTTCSQSDSPRDRSLPPDLQSPSMNPIRAENVPLPNVQSQGSLIDGMSMSYYHWGWDYPAVDTDGVGICRVHRPLDMAIGGSFGPGVLCNYDHTLSLTQSTNTGAREINASVVDPMVTKTRSYKRLNSASGTDFPILKPTARDPMKKLSLLKSDMTAVDASNDGAFHGAAYVLVEAWDGNSILFKLFDLGQGNHRIGKPLKLTTSLGDTTLVYKTFTQTQLNESPSRALQIDTVTDHYGNVLTFTYNSTQVSGQWVVSSIAVPGSNTRTYNYSSGKLASVDYPTGLQSTFSYGSDNTVKSTTIAMNDRAAQKGHQNKTAYLSNMAVGQVNDYGNGQVFFNCIRVNSIRMLTNPADEVSYLSLRGTSAYILQYEGAGRMKLIGTDDAGVGYPTYDKATSQFLKTFTVTPSGNQGMDNSWFTLTATADTLEGQYINPTTSPISFNRVQPNGTQCLYLFDTDNCVIAKEYPDGTFETYCYNSFKKVTRYRDRLKRVTKNVYNSSGQLLEKHVGLEDHPTNTNTSGGYTGIQYYDRCATNDVQTSAYAVYKWTYVASGAAKGRILTTVDPRNNQTDFEYNSQGRLWKIIEPADTTGGSRATTIYTYTASGKVASITDPEGHAVSYTYDNLQRKTTTTYGDGTTEKIEYGTSGNGNGLVVKKINRMNVVDTFEYDSSQRLTTKVTAAATRSGSTDTATDYGVAVTETFTYLKGTDNVHKHTTNGSVREYVYDYRGRLLETKVFPRANKTLVSKRQYENNQLYKTTDPYDRCTYYAYDATDGRLVRTITATVPEWSPPAPTGTQTLNQVLLAVTRDTGSNAKYIVTDLVNDAEGQAWKQFDGRQTETRTTFDGQGRTSIVQVAYGTSIEAKTETIYDAASNVTEVRSPRYFDSSDSEGYNKARDTWTYNNRNLQATHVEAPGTSIAATESFTYDLGGHVATKTDFGSSVWTTIEAGCCALTRASVDPLGHGSIINADSLGRVTHQVTISDVTSHSSNYNSPIDAKTLSESTTKYDPRNRATHRTTWLSVRGLVDTANPPIAGLNSVAIADGLTTLTFYDDNLTDGTGLDNSTGVSVIKQSGTSPSGTFNVSLTNALTKLADTQANGGAGISFNSSQGAVGRAAVTVNAEDEISFSISDSAGRTVMSGKLNNYKGSGGTALNTLATWSTQLHDTTASLSGYGTVLESKSIDALGFATRSWTDAAGRTLKSFDQLDKATVVTFDANGNQLTVRDPNNVGADMIFDVLNRNTQRTDTVSAVTKTAYDKAGNATKQTDAKNKDTFITFDARGRRKQTTDRISASTNFTYTAMGQLASLSDAESQVTGYTYSARGEKLTETYPDHTGGNPGDTTYGIVTFVYDNAGRTMRKQDQLGDTCTYLYDLAGRMTQRDYRLKVNSPSSTIADSDTFTFNRVGRILTAVSGRYSNTVGHGYDLVGRKSTESLTTNGQTYTITTDYNVRGELIKYTYPDSSIQDRSYHANGALNQLKLDGNTISTRSYDDGTRLTGETLGNGVTETRAYSNDNLLTSITFGGTGTAIGNLSYTWDANKNKTSETIGGVMADYSFTSGGTTYDNEDRLTGYARSGTSSPSQLSQSWSLTSVGDWTTTTINGTSHTRTHGPTHELLTDKIGSASAQSVTTDLKGNITSIPLNLRESGATTAMNLVWDFDNRLKSADVNADNTADVTYTYDALGRRATRSHTSGSWVFVQSDQQTLCDYVIGTAPSNALYRYVYASYIDEPVVRKQTGTGGTILYYHRNQQYSTYAITSSTGTVLERYAYTAYGQPTILHSSGSVLASSSIAIRHSYTGREWDEVAGLHYFRARWVTGNGGRFLSRDPIGFKGSEWDLYEFVGARALQMIDPSGMVGTINPGITPYGIVPPRDYSGQNFIYNPAVKRCIFHMSDTPNYSGGSNGIPGSVHKVSSKGEILQAIKDEQCCEIVFFSHQGANSNPGGVKHILPDPKFEKELREVFEKNCKICGIVSFACGGDDPEYPPGYPTRRDNNRKNIAKNTGCHYFGLQDTPYVGPSKNPNAGENLEKGRMCTVDKSLHGKVPPRCPNMTYGPFTLYPYPSDDPIHGSFIE
jgi:RHS repeat-associated protein